MISECVTAESAHHKPLVSIIVPTFNREEHLCWTLADLLSQDCGDVEILVIDQSTHHQIQTEQYLASIADKVQHIRLTTANLPAARNLGVERSHGHIVAFFDDDVKLDGAVISRLIRAYRNPNVWGVSGTVLPSTMTGSSGAVGRSSAEAAASAPLVMVDTFYGCCMSFRRALFEKIGYFDEWIGTQPTAHCEDVEFCLRASRSGLRLYRDPTVNVYHPTASAGGCGNRSSGGEELLYHHLMLGLYCHIKNPRYPGWAGILDAMAYMYRGYILNRGLLSRGLRQNVSRHCLFYRAMMIAARAVRENSRTETPNAKLRGSRVAGPMAILGQTKRGDEAPVPCDMTSQDQRQSQ